MASADRKVRLTLSLSPAEAELIKRTARAADRTPWEQAHHLIRTAIRQQTQTKTSAVAEQESARGT